MRLADPATVRVVTAYATVTAQVRTRVEAFVRNTWLGLGSWRDADVTRFVDRVIPVVAAGQRQVAALTDAYLAHVAATVLGVSPGPTGQLVATDLRGVAPAEVYRRPGVTAWTALSNGKTLTAAVEAGLARAVSLALTDLQLAKTHTARHNLERDGRAVGYRRVLEGPSSCGLCIVASTQRYHKKDLLPIHPGCDCSVLPIYSDHDPGQVIDPESLAGVHDKIAERFGGFDAGARGRDGIPAYQDVIIVHDHGEIGPILSVRGQHFTAADDL